MAKTYFVNQGAMPTTTPPVSIATGTSTKTLIQIATPSTNDIKIVEWGISFDGTSGTPIKVGLTDTNVAATVTAFVAADVIKWNQPNDPASVITLGTAASGYTASAEGTVTASRELDSQLVSPTGSYVKQFPLGREPIVPASRFLRLRVLAAATVNAYCYVIWEE